MRQFRKISAFALIIGLSGCASTPGSMFEANMDALLKTEGKASKAQSMQTEMQLASAALAGGDAGGAIRIYRKLTSRYPGAMEPRLALGEALLAANAPQEAAWTFEGAKRLNSKSHAALAGLARANLAIRQPAIALHYFDAALKQEPGDALTLNGKAVALDQLGRHEEAQSIYLDLLDQDPSNIKVRNNYGLSLALDGRSAEASDVLASLTAAPDSEARVRHNLALAYGLSGNDGRAAHISRLDLDEDAVQNNLKFFQRLRNLKDPVDRAAVLSKPASVEVSKAFVAVPTAGVEEGDEFAQLETHDYYPEDEYSSVAPGGSGNVPSSESNSSVPTPVGVSAAFRTLEVEALPETSVSATPLPDAELNGPLPLFDETQTLMPAVPFAPAAPRKDDVSADAAASDERAAKEALAETMVSDGARENATKLAAVPASTEMPAVR